MDYMVFLMSRIREEHVHGLQTREAVEHGIAAIGRVVVAAAIIMGTVFAAFILSADRIPKEFGLLLAVAILTDALIVRMTLVPALLTLLGEKTWYIPRWLDRLLPNITIEAPHEGEVPWRHRAEAGRGDGRVVGNDARCPAPAGHRAPRRPVTRARGTPPATGAGGTGSLSHPAGNEGARHAGSGSKSAQRSSHHRSPRSSFAPSSCSERPDRVALRGRVAAVADALLEQLLVLEPPGSLARGSRCRARGPGCRSPSTCDGTAPRGSRTSR